MELIYYYLHTLPYLYLAQGAFTIWMLVDAYRRHADAFWYWVILIIQPFGAWAYFFAVKLRDASGWRGLFAFQRRVSLAELRYRAEQTPTLANHLALGERLVERGVYGEAVAPLESVVAKEPDHCHGLFALATCYVHQGQPDRAIPLIERINARDRCWGNYAAWHLLVEAHDQRGDPDAALAACREVARLAPTLQHRCLLAEHLLRERKTEEARSLLRQSLADHRFAPGFIRRRNRRWARHARRLQKQAVGR